MKYSTIQKGDFIKQVRYLVKYLNKMFPKNDFLSLFKNALKFSIHNKDQNLGKQLEIATAVIKEIGMGLESVVSSILYKHSLSKEYLRLIRKEFGYNISKIVCSVNALYKNRDEARFQNNLDLRDFYIHFTEDIRVLLIKIICQLVELRSIKKVTTIKKCKKSLEAKFTLLPLTQRLGLDHIKSELEDLCLKYLYPKIYYSIAKKIKLTKSKRHEMLYNFYHPIKKALEYHNVKFSLKNRVKSLSSIWQKVQRRGIPFDQIYDSLGIRIIIDFEGEKKEEHSLCWKVYDIIKSMYKVMDEKTRNWLSEPKENGYEALHMTILSKDGCWGEVQIRTKKMDFQAENGSAGHWKYKGLESLPAIPGLEGWFNEIKSYITEKRFSYIELFDKEKLSLIKNDILVFPKGEECIRIVNGSSVLDFVLNNNYKNAHKLIGAISNNKTVPINYILKNGDALEPIFSKEKQAKIHWMNFLNTQSAKERLAEVI